VRGLGAEIGEGGAEGEELGVGVHGADELQADAAGERQCDGGKAGERDRRGVAEDGGAGGGVVVAGAKRGDGGAGVEEIVEAIEERGGAGAEGFHVGEEVGGLLRIGGGSGFKASGDDGIKMVEVAAMKLGGL